VTGVQTCALPISSPARTPRACSSWTSEPIMTAESSALPGSDRGGALEGVVVVELAQSLAGEFAGGLLADMGATVVKVEPRDGSPLRRRGPGIAGEDSL